MDTKQIVSTLKSRPRWLLLLIIRWQGFLISLGLLAIAIVTLDDWIADQVAHGTSFYFGELRPWIHNYVNSLLPLVILIALSPLGNKRLGKRQSPRFEFIPWFAMLYTAGLSLDFFYWSVTETLYHFESNPLAGETALASQALSLSIFHWGLHPWAIMAFAVFCFSHLFMGRSEKTGESTTEGATPWFWFFQVSALMLVFAIIALTMTATVASGSDLLYQSIRHEFLIDNAIVTHVIIVLVAVTCFTVLSFRSLNGIRYLAMAMIALFGILTVALYISGPGLTMLANVFSALWIYGKEIINYSTWIDPNEDAIWQNVWTTSYWAWWIIWSPFFGVFIAKISAGRRLRSILLTTLLLPPCIDLLWIGASGGISVLVQAGELSPTPFDPLQTLKVEPAAALFLLGYYPELSTASNWLRVIMLLLAAGFLAISLTSATSILPDLSSHPESGQQALRQRLVMLTGLSIVLVVLDFYNTLIEILQLLSIPLVFLLLCHAIISLWTLLLTGRTPDPVEDPGKSPENPVSDIRPAKLIAEKKKPERRSTDRIEPHF